MTDDDSSSCYSVEDGQAQEPSGMKPSYERLLRPVPEHPIPTEAEHEIRDIGGSTTSLEDFFMRSQMWKTNISKSPEERELKDNLTSHQWENEFFGICSDIFQELRLSALEVSNEIISQSQHCMLQRMFKPEDEPMSKEFMRAAVDKLDAQLQLAHQKEDEAKQAWREKWKQKKDAEFLMPWI